MQKPQNCLLGDIQVINDRLSVVESACCEHVDVVVLAHAGQELLAPGSHVESELITFVGMGDIRLLVFVEDRMNERLVEIKNQKLLLAL
jgi:hypothetical protein